ncbi:hypothetical protein [Streptomyces sp. NBC_01264]|uniref:hypothetical protein n=1 Tax=Streptomyces sp. NBC_01264 TaxID=2903804 RepID=UPI0022567965|nr:hypothetical protein [Streptomyces sp. NBC_01264]MCX4778126.1 hypothetical protein [Streptomyces sp. NBC_01264]
MTTEPIFSVAAWKAMAATLGIPVTTTTDAFGRTDVLINRAGMERFRDAALAVGHTDIAAIFTRCLEQGGQR